MLIYQFTRGYMMMNGIPVPGHFIFSPDILGTTKISDYSEVPAPVSLGYTIAIHTSGRQAKQTRLAVTGKTRYTLW